MQSTIAFTEDQTPAWMKLALDWFYNQVLKYTSWTTVPLFFGCLAVDSLFTLLPIDYLVIQV